MNKNFAGFTCFGIVAFTFFAVVATLVSSGWALSVLWGWFIVPLFSIAQISIPQALGISLVFNMLKGYNLNINKEKKETSELIIDLLVPIFSPLMAVGFGWIIKMFL